MTAFAGVALVAGGLLAACNGSRRIDRGEPPTFESAAEAHNLRAHRVDRLWARATTQVRYTDDDGKRRLEQGEGHLRIEPPSHVALSAGKIGETLFWLGGDDRRYWWFDLTGKDRLASVGSYGGPGMGKGGLAATVRPRDLATLMALVPIEGPGATQWSDDGQLLGVTARHTDGRYERRWLDPVTFEPKQVEIWANDGVTPLITSELGEHQHLAITGQGEPGPKVPTQVFIGDAASGTEVRLYLTDAGDGGSRWDAAAFDFDRLLGALGASRVNDLDGKAGDRPTWRGYE